MALHLFSLCPFLVLACAHSMLACRPFHAWPLWKQTLDIWSGSSGFFGQWRERRSTFDVSLLSYVSCAFAKYVSEALEAWVSEDLPHCGVCQGASRLSRSRECNVPVEHMCMPRVRMIY